jgi:UDP-N-acetylbacillosamine N-acetyltransferase
LENNLNIFGYSGHAYVVLDAAVSMNLSPTGYFDKKEASKNPYQLIYKGSENAFDFLDIDPYTLFFPAIGNNQIRKNVFEFAINKSLKIISIIHYKAILSEHAVIGKGTLVSSGAIINSMVKIGDGAIINTGAIIEHECKIGSFTHLAPGCVLAGSVNIGSRCFIGANAVIKEGVSIGSSVTIGAGAVVLHDINDGETFVGNPAKRIK